MGTLSIIIRGKSKLAAQLADVFFIKVFCQFHLNGFSVLAMADIPDAFAHHGIDDRTSFILFAPDVVPISHNTQYSILIMF
ncbi:hypothetical protein [Alloprevotella tannerae]|uniref:hypothetical protein n=1 Tax=Alloprevotella tannerae TaxID=76122 RepID=UPI00288AABB5|nr:hypothetical protein [Alloprevotella tannerae]